MDANRPDSEEIAAQIDAVLGGARLEGSRPEDWKILRIAATSREGADIHIAPDQLTMRFVGWSRRKAFPYLPRLGPVLLSRLLERGQVVGDVREPLVAKIALAGMSLSEEPLALWVLPLPSAVQLYARRLPAELLPAAPQPVPAVGPLAAPDPLLDAPVLPPRRFRALEVPHPCPICHEVSAEYRDLDDRLVCPRCHRSFADPSWR